MEKIYDTIIMGGGPAGYTAALYAVRAGLKALVLEKFSAGGQMTQTHTIDNYPGFDEGIDGFTLGYKMQKGAERFGAQTLQTEVLEADLKAFPKVITADAGRFYAKTVIIATGADHKRLGVPEEQALTGRGVAYCAACDGMLYRGKRVAVIGGGNSAAADALLLSKICEKVYVIHRRDTLRAEKVYYEPLTKAQNIEFVWNSRLESFIHDQKVKGIRTKKNDGSTKDIELDGVFISIGRVPVSHLFAKDVATDEKGYIIADETTKTSVDGVFAAGDVRSKAVRQIVTAAADGAVAVHFAQEYLAKI
ncbi:MAG: thioredoxin-disulfide reductase [Clostridia bacterium]|nr:thioredoxin-disulfide reductase [Clostridia bacterium]